MKEKDITSVVLKSMRDWPSAAIEIKLCKGNSIPFSALADHQMQALWHAKHQSLIFKIPDMGYLNPFDAFLLNNSAAWVVVVFYRPRKNKTCVMIDIDNWIKELNNNEGTKSLTMERAKQIGNYYDFLH